MGGKPKGMCIHNISRFEEANPNGNSKNYRHWYQNKGCRTGKKK